MKRHPFIYSLVFLIVGLLFFAGALFFKYKIAEKQKVLTSNSSDIFVARQKAIDEAVKGGRKDYHFTSEGFDPILNSSNSGGK